MFGQLWLRDVGFFREEYQAPRFAPTFSLEFEIKFWSRVKFTPKKFYEIDS